MVEDTKYFRVKRKIPKDADLGRLTKEGLLLLNIMLNRAHFDVGVCVFSFQEGARLLKCSRKKATAEMQKLKSDGYIDFNSVQGEHRFEVKLNFYYPVDPQKEQVKTNEEQVKEQDRSFINKHGQEEEKNKLRNKKTRSNTIEYNTMECNEIKYNEILSFFGKQVPKEYVEKYGKSNVLRKIGILTFDYKDKPPDNPLGLLKTALDENYAPSDKFLENEKREQYGQPDRIRSNNGLENPFGVVGEHAQEEKE